MKTYFSHGKLLLTSEYMVLAGALALAVPTRWGQSLQVEYIPEVRYRVEWEAYHQGKRWLQVEIDYKTWQVLSTNLPENAQLILNTLKNVAALSTTKMVLYGRSYKIKTNLDFPANYGLGSSSTLMGNLAKWAGVDAYALNEKSLGGSGYDIAVALEGRALLYQLLEDHRRVQPVVFNPEFKSELRLVHLGKKQDSREGIRLFRTVEKSREDVLAFTEITQAVGACTSLTDFSVLMETHEARLSKLIGLDPVKRRYFPDCPTFVKSLGAWGGDFVLTSAFEGVEDYFKQKGYGSVFSYSDLVF